MAYNEDAMAIASTGRVLLGAIGATAPTLAEIKAFVTGDETNDPYEIPPTGFTDLGNTDLESGVTFSGDDATTEVKGSWQNKKIREIETEAAVERFEIISLQPKDGDVLKLYYGGGTALAGSFVAPRAGDTAPAERFAVLIFVDGSEVIAALCPKTSIKRNGQLTFPNDDWAQVPLVGTILDPASGSPTTWLSDDITVGV